MNIKIGRQESQYLEIPARVYVVIDDEHTITIDVPHGHDAKDVKIDHRIEDKDFQCADDIDWKIISFPKRKIRGSSA